MRSNVRSPEPNDDEIALTAAAERARMSVSHVGNMARDGRIVARRVGPRVFVNVNSLRDYLRRTRCRTM